MPNNKIELISHDKYRGRYMVIIFYPFDFSYVCPTELLAFSEKFNDFRNLGTDIIAISTDS